MTELRRKIFFAPLPQAGIGNGPFRPMFVRAGQGAFVAEAIAGSQALQGTKRLWQHECFRSSSAGPGDSADTQAAATATEAASSRRGHSGPAVKTGLLRLGCLCYMCHMSHRGMKNWGHTAFRSSSVKTLPTSFEGPCLCCEQLT